MIKDIDSYMLFIGFRYNTKRDVYFNEHGVFLWNVLILFNLSKEDEINYSKLGFIKIHRSLLEKVVQLDNNLLPSDYLWILPNILTELKKLYSENHELLIQLPNPKWIQTPNIYSVYSKNYMDIIPKQKKLK